MELRKLYLTVGASLLLYVSVVGCGNKSGDEGEGGVETGGNASGTGGDINGTGGTSAGGTGGTTIIVTGGDTGSGGSTVCADTDFHVTGRIVDMLIVLDRSQSMFDSNLWVPMGQALTRVTAATEGSVNFGLLTFPFSDAECDPGNILLPITPTNASAIADVVGGGPHDVGTSYGTPTAESLRVAKEYLDSVQDGLDKFVLLANDGAPNCNDSLDSMTCRCSVRNTFGCTENWWCLDDGATTEAAGALSAAGYPVYVLGIGEGMEWADVMNAVAVAGGTGQYIPADSDQFETVLMDIVGGIMSCDFEVDWDSLAGNATRDPEKVNLYCKQGEDEPNNPDPVAGNVIPKNEGCANGGFGWTWSDETNTVIRMCDESCTTLKNGGCPVVSATFGCKSVVVY